MSQLAHTPTSGIPKYAQDADRPYEGDPWSRQREESSKSYMAFCIYLELDKRTYAETDRRYCKKTGLKYNTSTPRVSNWAKKHRWQERALAYDNYMAAAQIAANKRALVASSAKHAKQAADVQSILMRPVDEYRKRMEEQGVDLVAEMDDATVLKMAVAFGRELPAMQKAERESLASTGDTVVPRAEVKVKGEVLRRLLADGTSREWAERLQFEMVAPLTTDDGDTPSTSDA